MRHVPPHLRFTIDDGRKPHPMRAAMPIDSAAHRLLTTMHERREAICVALIEHCGGIDAARQRVAIVIAQPWEPDAPWRSIMDVTIGELTDSTSCTHVTLDGAVAWIGGFDSRMRWRERLAPGCPASVADALPCERG